MMKKRILPVAISLLSLAPAIASASSFKLESLGNGFIAMYQQSDPFDTKKKEYLSVSKGDFVFNCQQISFGQQGTYYHDSFSFSASVALKVDNNDAIQKSGTYSTYQFGSDLINDDRMYTTRLTPEVIQQLKDGNTLNASGKWGSTGWNAHKLNLKGFTKAFNKVCK